MREAGATAPDRPERGRTLGLERSLQRPAMGERDEMRVGGSQEAGL